MDSNGTPNGCPRRNDPSTTGKETSQPTAKRTSTLAPGVGASERKGVTMDIRHSLGGVYSQQKKRGVKATEPRLGMKHTEVPAGVSRGGIFPAPIQAGSKNAPPDVVAAQPHSAGGGQTSVAAGSSEPAKGSRDGATAGRDPGKEQSPDEAGFVAKPWKDVRHGVVQSDSSDDKEDGEAAVSDGGEGDDPGEGGGDQRGAVDEEDSEEEEEAEDLEEEENETVVAHTPPKERPGSAVGRGV